VLNIIEARIPEDKMSEEISVYNSDYKTDDPNWWKPFNKSLQAADSEVYVKIVQMHEHAIQPTYQTKGAAGMDIHSVVDLTISPGKTALVQTGIGLGIPEGYEAQVRPRSGLAFKYGVTVLNAPGTIDSDYRGEVKVILINHGDQEFIIRRGDRIAQLVFCPVNHATLIVTDRLDSTDRGAGGFGSTGK
jgi:dUTP pyrophosphatase